MGFRLAVVFEDVMSKRIMVFCGLFADVMECSDRIQE
jgi:hypothetical protein